MKEVKLWYLFGCPDDYISTDKSPRKNTIAIDASDGKIVVELVRDSRIEVCSLVGTLNDWAMLLWVKIASFWKLMEYRKELQTLGITGEDYSDFEVLRFLRD